MPDQGHSPAEVLPFLWEQRNSPFGAVTSFENWVAQTRSRSQLKREGLRGQVGRLSTTRGGHGRTEEAKDHNTATTFELGTALTKSGSPLSLLG